MPQLVKGGKYVYGLSGISSDGIVIIPPEAMKEYKFFAGEKVIVINGSRTSGGFGLTKKSLLEKSKLNVMGENLPGLMNFQLPEAELVASGRRLFCWMTISDGGSIRIPSEALSGYGLKPGNPLAVGRGSYLSLAFIARGPILGEALKHPELEIFGG